jgi:MFS family permease
MATNPLSRTSTDATAVTHGDIAARIDRLPLTRIQYGYVAITQIFWGLIIATDGMPARLYPFLWEPRGMSNFEFSVLLSANIGAGILAGEYLGSFLADRFGRKKILALAPIIDAVFLWPIGFTDAFWWLLVWCFLFAIGMGFLLATNAVYLHEIAPQHRHKIAMRTQMLTALAAMGPAIASFYWIPSHYRWFLFLLAGVQVFILVPLGLLLASSASSRCRSWCWRSSACPSSASGSSARTSSCWPARSTPPRSCCCSSSTRSRAWR